MEQKACEAKKERMKEIEGKAEQLLGKCEFMVANETDLTPMLNIYNYYIMNTTATFDLGPISMEEFKNRIFIKHPKYKTYLIYEENELLGFCFITQFRSKTAYDKTAEIGLYLKPEFTGKGLGAIIVNYLESVARQGHFETLIASISGDNLSSIKLFEKLGYEKCAHYKRIAEKFNRKVDIIDFQRVICEQ
jgi:phosphinothricin acetyltransferase